MSRQKVNDVRPRLIRKRPMKIGVGFGFVIAVAAAVGWRRRFDGEGDREGDL